MCRTMRSGWLVACALTCLGVVSSPRRAAAQSTEAQVARASDVLRLNREAMELYESLDFELAEKQLLEALAVARKNGLENHTVTAKTHANLALVYSGLKRQDQAVAEFKAALAIRPDYRPSKEQSSPDTDKLFNRAKRELAAGGTAGAEAASAAVPAAAETGGAPGVTDALRCPTAGEVDAGDDITLKCVTSAELPATSVVLYYKRAGVGDFIAVPMRAPDPGARKAVWSAKIPGNVVSGDWLPFYFEAKGQSGEALALSGRDDSPNILTIRGSAGRGSKAKPTTSSLSGDEDENPLEEIARRGEPGAGPREGVFFGLAVGSGMGYAGGDGVEAYHNQVRGFTAGVAPAVLGHIAPEIGFYLNRTTALLLQGRLQYIPRDTTVTAGGAVAALAKILFFTSPGRSRFYGALAAGGGEGFRLSVQATRTDGTVITDTVRGGPLVAGLGGGYVYDLSPTFAWLLETNAYTGFPKFSAVVDLNTGIRAAF